MEPPTFDFQCVECGNVTRESIGEPMTLKELCEKFPPELPRWNIDNENDAIEYLIPGDSSYPSGYWLRLSDHKCMEDIVDSALHVSEKVWCRKRDVTDIIKVLCKHIGLNPYTGFGKSKRPTKTRQPISPSVRWSVFRRDGFACRYCGAKAGADVELVLDHAKSVADGGNNSEANLWTSCKYCNAGKGRRSCSNGEFA